MPFKSVEVNNTPEPVVSEADATAAALAAADGNVQVDGQTVVAPAVTPDKTERPDNVPEKFWNAEKGIVNVDAVLASNKELQGQFTKDKQGEGEGEGDQTPAPEGDQTPAPEGDQSANPIAAAQANYEKDGAISEADYAALDAVGLDKATVDGYIAGQKAIGDGIMNHAYSLTGGEEGFNEMHAWAGQNLSEDEMSAYNAQVMNAETSDYAIAQLFARFSENRPMDTDLLNGDGDNTNTGEFFKSAAEMQVAMSDLKYKNDPAFRKEVEQKIANADAAGINLFV